MYGLRGLGLDIVATMPPLPASACAAGQTYIPPGGMFTSGPSAGRVTSTGACQDMGNTIPPPPILSQSQQFLTSTGLSNTIGGIPLWALIAGVGVALFAFGSGGSGGGRRMNPGHHYGRPFHGRNAKYRDKEYKRLKKQAKREKKAQRG
jgi:hypothetical protein